MTRPRIAAWQGVIGACAVLAVPTAVAPDGALAGPAYLTGLLVIVLALVAGRYTLSPEHRRPWTLITLASASAATGALVWQLSLWQAAPGGLGPQDGFWLAFYPLMTAGVLRMMRARALTRPVRRAILHDVTVVTAAAAVFAWHALIQPVLGGAEPTHPWTTAVYVTYPLGDVCVFALGLALVLAPGSRCTAEILLVGSLGLALPLDYLHALLLALAPGAGDGWYMAGYLVVNGLLGAAAVHPDRTRLTSPSPGAARSWIQNWRIALLGSSLTATCLSVLFLTESGWQRVPVGLSVLAALVAIMSRFQQALRDQDRAELSLRHQAHHDQLTGAANRALLLDELQDAVQQGIPGLLCVDLDGFKAINDSFGHHTGDEVLIAVTQRLRSVVRSGDTVARIGGDEFVILCRGLGEGDIEALAQRIVEAIARPLIFDGQEVRVGASVGVLALDRGDPGALATDPETTGRVVGDLMRTADAAMYEAKRSGGGVRITHYADAG